MCSSIGVRNLLACMEDTKRGRGEGTKKSMKAGKRVPYPLSPIPLPFSLPPYPLSTPAMQATQFLVMTIMIIFSHRSPSLTALRSQE